jgi:hypothetical protein
MTEKIPMPYGLKDFNTRVDSHTFPAHVVLKTFEIPHLPVFIYMNGFLLQQKWIAIDIVINSKIGWLSKNYVVVDNI